MNVDHLTLETLEDHVRCLAVAESAADVFRALLEGARVAAPRSTVFLLRQGQLKGWGAVGYPAEAARRQREYIGPTSSGWLAEVLRSEPPLHTDAAARALPGFGQPTPAECVGMSIRVKGRPIAIMVWERLPGELPWQPAALPLFVRVGQLRLDLDLALRKLSGPSAAARPAGESKRRATPADASVAPLTAGAAPADRSAPPTEPAPDPADPAPAAVVEIADAAPPPSSDAPAEDQDPRLAAARRYARLVATDIRLYNEEAVVLGRRDGDLAERLRESLLRGKETFQRRHADLGPVGMKILHDAFVEVLAGGEGRLLPASELA